MVCVVHQVYLEVDTEFRKKFYKCELLRFGVTWEIIEEHNICTGLIHS